MKHYLTISDLVSAENQTAPIWALNNAADSEVGQAGEIHIGIPKANGTKVDDLHLPQTWLPQELTGQIPREQLLAASEFRTALNNNLIRIITPEYAATLLAEDGADEERSRLIEAKRAVREATKARGVTDGGADIINTNDMDVHTGIKEEPKSEIDESFVMLVESLKSVSDVEAMNKLRGRGKFKRAELALVQRELHDKPKVQALVSKLLSR